MDRQGAAGNRSNQGELAKRRGKSFAPIITGKPMSGWGSTSAAFNTEQLRRLGQGATLPAPRTTKLGKGGLVLVVRVSPTWKRKATTQDQLEDSSEAKEESLSSIKRRKGAMFVYRGMG